MAGLPLSLAAAEALLVRASLEMIFQWICDDGIVVDGKEVKP
jgi:hypothetical protein